MARLPGQGAAERRLQGFVAEGLGEGGAVLEAGREALRAVARGEDQGDAALAQDLGDREDHRAAHIDVEDRRVEFGRLRQRDRVAQVGDRPDHLAAEVENHVLDKHGDHGLDYDDEDAATWVLTHALLPKQAGKARLTSTVTLAQSSSLDVGARVLPRLLERRPGGSVGSPFGLDGLLRGGGPEQ